MKEYKVTEYGWNIKELTEEEAIEKLKETQENKIFSLKERIKNLKSGKYVELGGYYGLMKLEV